jgi:hypothetical protein
MAYTLWSQDIFSKGELSPFMYARCTTNEYNNGLKTAQNVLNYPTGAAGKRFGTLFQTVLSNVTTPQGLYFQTFQYLNECVYQLVFETGNVDIYLEGVNVASFSTSLTENQVYNIISTVLGPVFRITIPGAKGYDLTRSANSPATVTSTSTNSFAASSAPFTAGLIYPVQFSVTGGTILQTVPQISPGVTYFVYAQSTTTAVLFKTAQDAKAYLLNQNDLSNVITITNGGTGTTSVIIQNTWSFANTVFTNVPFYDFLANYDSIQFSVSAVTGIATLGASAPIFTAALVGGAFIGGGGSGRLTAFTDSTHMTIAVQMPFESTSVYFQGSLCLLAEPAWSDVRGWPQVCSSYQNRALFANTASLPNGFWASVINDYANFGDLTTDDDDAISWYPTSDNMNYIKFIVPYRSITVHTNTGIYSSPLSDIVAITPSNFTLQLQDSTPADVLQPQAIDNQVLVLSGNDAHQMLWDGINNAYTSDIVSVVSEQTIRNPMDETAFQDLRRAGSRFVFIINENGSMAAFQTLITQNVAGFTPQIMEQSYGSALFIQAASSSDGRCWFVVQRQVANAASGIAISGFTSTTLKATASNFSTTVPTAITFTTSGALPASSPQLAVSTYYWAIGTDANDFEVFLDQADALAGVNQVSFTSDGTSSDVVPWPLTTIYTLEELTEDVFLDCAVQYNGVATDTVTTGVLFNAQDIKMVGDGFGFDSPAEQNVSNEVVFYSHGQTVQVTSAYVGFPIVTIMEPMPLAIANGPSAKENTLTKPKHIRTVRFMFNQTIGGTINGVPIALNTFEMANIGEPPFPAMGIVELDVMKAWDDFNNPSYTIYHDDPFNIILLGVFYSVEV